MVPFTNVFKCQFLTLLVVVMLLRDKILSQHCFKVVLGFFYADQSDIKNEIKGAFDV